VIYVGTSGWQYRDWRHRFYPDGLPVAGWLTHYATRFPVVEVNSSFYRLPNADVVGRWAEQTPSEFLFAVKASRYLTHVRRLRDAAEPVQRLLERLAPLGPKLGPILVQLPPTLDADPVLLDEALSLVPLGQRIVVEPRNPSWFNDAVQEVLASRGAVLCAADRQSRIVSPLWDTADWAYVRLHEGTAAPRPCYGDAALGHWLSRIVDTWGDRDVFVFFNNDQRACAPANAARLQELARRGGVQTVCSRSR
jgi:uncharacterized protein YecE (DUF72 family)